MLMEIGMKKQLFYSLFVIILFICSCSTQIEVEDIRGSRLEYLNTDSNKDDILLIDTRPYEKYKEGHIIHAINIPLSEISRQIDTISKWKNKPICLYDEDDDKSFKAAEVLAANRFKIIYNAEGLKQYNYADIVSYINLTGSEFEKLLEEQDSIIIDCRSKTSYDAGHIKGAISIPVSELEQNLNKLPKDKKIFLYCNVGTASSRASGILSNHGYTQIYNSIEGILEYPFKLVTKTSQE